MFSDALTASGMVADAISFHSFQAREDARRRDRRLAELDAIWRAHHDALAAQYDNLLARHNALVGQYNGLLDMLRQAEADRNAAQTQVARFAGQLVEAEARNRALQEQVERLEFSLQQAQRQANQLQDRIIRDLKARGLL